MLDKESGRSLARTYIPPHTRKYIYDAAETSGRKHLLIPCTCLIVLRFMYSDAQVPLRATASDMSDYGATSRERDRPSINTKDHSDQQRYDEAIKPHARLATDRVHWYKGSVCTLRDDDANK